MLWVEASLGVKPIASSLLLQVLHAIWYGLQSKWSWVTGLVAFGASLAKVWPFIWSKYEAARDYRLLTKRIGGELYTREDFYRATEFYVEPDCQLIDPAGQEDFRHLVPFRSGAHRALLDVLKPTSPERFLILLADSGMGKTTVLMNFYVRYGRGKLEQQQIVIVPLGHPKADDLISAVQDKGNTILFLDAFDEDTKAIANYKLRLSTLLEACREFSKILLTCRTQFFETDAEIPQETGLMRFAAVSASQSKLYTFSKFYLSPFSDGQVDEYVRKRFPFWRRKDRSRTRQIVAATPDLTLRPMLLSHIPDLIAGQKSVSSISDLYAAMVDAWLRREKPFVEPDHLRKFSLALAANLYSMREERGSETISPAEALTLAREVSVPLESWQLRGRSLLNRNADGRLKFSHRSLMEYLFVVGFLEAPTAMKKLTWTDQMKRFWWDMVKRRHSSRYSDDRFTELSRDMSNGRLYGDCSDLVKLGLRQFLFAYGYGHLSELNDQVTASQAIPLIGPLLFERIAMPPLLASADGLEPGDHCVIDLALGLMWQDKVHLVRGSDDLSIYRRKRGWRVPTLYEYSSLRPVSAEDIPGRRSVTYSHTSSRVGDYPRALFTDWPEQVWVSDHKEQPWKHLNFGKGSERVSIRSNYFTSYDVACVRFVRPFSPSDLRGIESSSVLVAAQG